MNAEGRPPKLPWGWLSAMLGGIVVLWVIAVRATGGSEGDRWLDLLFLVLVFGVMWFWVGANRAALAQDNPQAVRVARIIVSDPSEALPRTAGDDSASTNGQPLQQIEGYIVCLVISDRR